MLLLIVKRNRWLQVRWNRDRQVEKGVSPYNV
jgi:hypothetical protein